jgi:esterase/lipase superfamily enzyme
MLAFGNGGGLLSGTLNSKGINHWLDDGKWRGHDWNYWRDMLPYYLSRL